ncbi:MAG: hypothetical protein ABI376_04735 [Caulobacteraceae bacterium]
MTRVENVRVSRSRRRLVGRAAAFGAVAGLVGVGLIPRPAAAAGRPLLAPGDIGYQTRPKGAQRCDLCVNWRPPAACKLVAGPISPTGWCGLFAPKA